MPINKNHKRTFLAVTLLLCCFSKCLLASTDDDISVFINAVKQAKADQQTIDLGNKIFTQLDKKYSMSPAFINLKSKLNSAGFLANKMISQLKRSMNRTMLGITDKKDASIVVAPAKTFYESSLSLFSKPIEINNLQSREKDFLLQYYNLVLKKLIENITHAGLGYAIAEPSFKGTYDYILVLPLLHTPKGTPINFQMLPSKVKNKAFLQQLADSALLHYGRVLAARSIAEKAASINNETFNEIDYFINAAKNCPKNNPEIAVDCLNNAIQNLDHSKTDKIIDLNIEIINTWQNAQRYALAAAHAKNSFNKFKNNPKTPYIIWLYYYSLSQQRDSDQILANIDTHIDDPTCDIYKPKLMYIKWWALRLNHNNTTQIQALQQTIIKQYPDNSIIAPIMLSMATDSIACQDYAHANAILNDLIQKFPSSRSAVQAKKITEKLNLQDQG